MSKQWTKSEIIALINKNNRAVEKGIVRIFHLQTQDEKCSNRTKHKNHVGFSACDARRGAYYASWVLSGKHLTGIYLQRARSMCIKYSGQLTDIANGIL